MSHKKSSSSKQKFPSRRDMLIGGMGAGLCATSLVAQAKENSQVVHSHSARRNATPKNIILLISDGMSIGVPTLANHMSHIIREESTAWTKLLSDPKAVHGYLETRSANCIVTDSSAAASAWGCGHRVNNGTLNITPDGKERLPICRILKSAGKRTGLVTTDKVTGATPSGFAVIQPLRSQYYDIAPQFIDHVDVLLGGGRKYFESEIRFDKRDLISEHTANGYAFCSNRRELLKLPASDKILGLFAEDKLPYTVDQLNDITLQQIIPTIAEMTQAAIQNLADQDEGFFLMVEGARVDHAAHTNDAASLVHDQIAFEDAVGVALKFAQQRDDTLVVMTSDHGNANPGLNGIGSAYCNTDESFGRLTKISASFDTIRERAKELAVKQKPAVAALEVIEGTCDIKLSNKIAEIVGDALVEDQLPEELAILQRSWVGVLSQVLGNHTAIGFTGTNHTADRVMITSYGPGAEHFEGIGIHTDLFHVFSDLMGISEKMKAASVAS